MNNPLQPLACLELERDPDAAQFVKDEIVSVIFAFEGGELQSPEGPNRYRKGDALVTGSTGGRWSVSRDRFDAKYLPVPPGVEGADGAYRARALPVWAKNASRLFCPAFGGRRSAARSRRRLAAAIRAGRPWHCGGGAIFQGVSANRRLTIARAFNRRGDAVAPSPYPSASALPPRVPPFARWNAPRREHAAGSTRNGI